MANLSLPDVSGTLVDASAVGVADGSRDVEEADLQAETKRLTTALEDIVALAHSSGDHRARVILMQRRAMAALSGTDRPLSPARRMGDAKEGETGT